MRAIKTQAICAALALALSAPCYSLGFLGFFFMGKAMDAIGEKIFSRGSSLPPGPPSWPVSNGAAELINDQLPLESSDGFAIMRARSPAPGALEIIVASPKGSEPAAQELDKTWGPGVIDLFCGPKDSIWTRWIKIGGTVGMVVQTPGGETIRRYGASRGDCEAIAARAAQ